MERDFMEKLQGEASMERTEATSQLPILITNRRSEEALKPSNWAAHKSKINLLTFKMLEPWLGLAKYVLNWNDSDQIS